MTKLHHTEYKKNYKNYILSTIEEDGEWLSGLALNLEYYNLHIVELAVKMGSVDENPSGKMQRKIIDNYWNFMANVILGFEPNN